MRADLHFHTARSDGTASPRTMVKLIGERGLDGFSPTDHDTAGDITEYRALAREYGLFYISGIEITTEKGHLLLYTTPDRGERLREVEPFKPISYYLEKASLLDFLVFPAHPFDYLRLGIGREVFHHPWSGVETFNGSTVFPLSNRRAEKAARAMHLPGIGGTDAHTPDYVGYAYTEADASTAEDFVACMKKGSVSPGGSHTTLVAYCRRMVESKIFK